MPPELREALEKAVQDVTAPPAPAAPSSPPAPAPAPAADAKPVGAPPPAPTVPNQGYLSKKEEPAAPAAKPAAAPAVPEKPVAGSPQEKTEEGQPSGEPTTPAYKPPASWRPGPREKLATADPEIQAEVERREKQFGEFTKSAKQDRTFVEAFSQTIAPYAQHIQESGVPPLQLVAQLMDTGYRLNKGSPAEKAAVIAAAIQDYGIDVELLDTVLSKTLPAPGQPRQPAQPQGMDPRMIQQMVQQAVAPLIQQRQQQDFNAVTQSIEEWGKNKPYFNDLRADMADVNDFEQARGRNLSLDDLYERALAMRPDVRRLIEARKQNAQAERAAQVSSSVTGARSGPLAPVQADPSDLRGTISAAFDNLQVGGRV